MSSFSPLCCNDNYNKKWFWSQDDKISRTDLTWWAFIGLAEEEEEEEEEVWFEEANQQHLLFRACISAITNLLEPFHISSSSSPHHSFCMLLELWVGGKKESDSSSSSFSLLCDDTQDRFRRFKPPNWFFHCWRRRRRRRRKRSSSSSIHGSSKPSSQDWCALVSEVNCDDKKSFYYYDGIASSKESSDPDTSNDKSNGDGEGWELRTSGRVPPAPRESSGDGWCNLEQLARTCDGEVPCTTSSPNSLPLLLGLQELECTEIHTSISGAS